MNETQQQPGTARTPVGASDPCADSATRARSDSTRADSDRMSRSLVKDLNPGAQKPANVR
jgi:hypothetical protein